MRSAVRADCPLRTATVTKQAPRRQLWSVCLKSARNLYTINHYWRDCRMWFLNVNEYLTKIWVCQEANLEAQPQPHTWREITSYYVVIRNSIELGGIGYCVVHKIIGCSSWFDKYPPGYSFCSEHLLPFHLWKLQLQGTKLSEMLSTAVK